jgi:hypothetical protein
MRPSTVASRARARGAPRRDFREHYALTLRRWISNLEAEGEAVAETGAARVLVCAAICWACVILGRECPLTPSTGRAGCVRAHGHG